MRVFNQHYTTTVIWEKNNFSREKPWPEEIKLEMLCKQSFSWVILYLSILPGKIVVSVMVPYSVELHSVLKLGYVGDQNIREPVYICERALMFKICFLSKKYQFNNNCNLFILGEDDLLKWRLMTILSLKIKILYEWLHYQTFWHKLHQAASRCKHFCFLFFPFWSV